MPFNFPEAGASAPASGLIAKENPVALTPYKVSVNGYETTLLLSDEDAKEQGLMKEPNKEPAKAQSETPAKKATAAPNKARKAPNKAK